MEPRVSKTNLAKIGIQPPLSTSSFQINLHSAGNIFYVSKQTRNRSLKPEMEKSFPKKKERFQILIKILMKDMT